MIVDTAEGMIAWESRGVLPGESRGAALLFWEVKKNEYFRSVLGRPAVLQSGGLDTLYNPMPKKDMFSGIVEGTARVVSVVADEGNVHLTLQWDLADELRIDQSLAHNGVCLTVVALPGDGTYTVTAISETLRRSNLGDLREGSLVNLERSMPVNGRLDGHIVQGHVDTTAVCTSIEDADGSRYFKFEYDIDPAMAARGYMTVEKGSVTVNGVSLTVCDSEARSFRVAIIPYTMDHTNFCEIGVGSRVNIEFDIIGKYLARLAGFADR